MEQNKMLESDENKMVEIVSIWKNNYRTDYLNYGEPNQKILEPEGENDVNK